MEDTPYSPSRNHHFCPVIVFSSSSLPPPQRDLLSYTEEITLSSNTTNTTSQILCLDPESFLSWSGFRLSESEAWSCSPLWHIPYLKQRAWKISGFQVQVCVCWGGGWEKQSKANMFSCHSPDVVSSLKCPWHLVPPRLPSLVTKLEPTSPSLSTGQGGAVCSFEACTLLVSLFCSLYRTHFGAPLSMWPLLPFLGILTLALQCPFKEIMTLSTTKRACSQDQTERSK